MAQPIIKPTTITGLLRLSCMLIAIAAGMSLSHAAVLAPSLQHARDATAAQRALGGTWTGGGTTMVVDIQRMQVNLDPEKPFEWQAFQLLNVSGKMIVFDIGRMRYVGLLADASTLILTSPSFVGEHALHLTRR